MMIAKLYRRLAQPLLERPNRLAGLRITIENRMTPLELEALTRDAASRPEEAKRQLKSEFKATTQARWCKKLNELCEGSGKPAPEHFARRRRERAWFISNGEDAKAKVLFLCFTGGARRMMMPLPVFLQHLDASLVDVVLFMDEDQDGFRRGFMDDEHNLVARAAKFADREKYRGIVTMGTSGGGLPAVLVALGLGADAALSVGGNDPNDMRWIMANGDDGTDLVNRYAAKLGGKLPDIYLIFSETYTVDANSAKALGEVVSARLISYSNPEHVERTGKPINHGVLHPMLLNGTFSSLLQSTIFSKFNPTPTGVQEDWSRFMSGPTLV